MVTPAQSPSCQLELIGKLYYIRSQNPCPRPEWLKVSPSPDGTEDEPLPLLRSRGLKMSSSNGLKRKPPCQCTEVEPPPPQKWQWSLRNLGQPVSPAPCRNLLKETFILSQPAPVSGVRTPTTSGTALLCVPLERIPESCRKEKEPCNTGVEFLAKGRVQSGTDRRILDSVGPSDL